MPLINTVTGVAEGLLGDVGQWRKVVEANPDQLFGKLPPSIQADITKYYNTVKDVTGRLNIRGLTGTAEDNGNPILAQLYRGQLGGSFSRASVELERLAGSKEVKAAQDILKQIDWLL